MNKTVLRNIKRFVLDNVKSDQKAAHKDREGCMCPYIQFPTLTLHSPDLAQPDGFLSHINK